MALNLQNKYPGRFDPVSADYPQGKFKNRSSPTAQDGSYMERDWLNDWAGFFGAILNNAGVVPNGSVDTAQSSQLFTALQTVISKQLPKRSFTQNDFIRIPDVPGGLIIQWGTATSNTSGLVTVTLPVAYPTAHVFQNVTVRNCNFAANSYAMSIGPNGQQTRTGLTALSSQPTSVDVNWLSMGY